MANFINEIEKYFDIKIKGGNKDFDQETVSKIATELYSNIEYRERVIRFIIFDELRHALYKPLGKYASIEDSIRLVFPLNKRQDFLNHIRNETGFNVPDLVISGYSLIFFILIYITSIAFYFYFIATNIVIALSIPPLFGFFFGFIISFFPVYLIDKVFPVLMKRRYFYYMKDLRDFVNKMAEMNTDDNFDIEIFKHKLAKYLSCSTCSNGHVEL